MKATDAIIATGLGAAKGYFGTKAQQGKDNREMDELDRRYNLIMQKEKNKQAAQEKLKSMELDYKTKKDAADDEFDLKKIDIQHQNKLKEQEAEFGYDKELEKIKAKNKSDKTDDLEEKMLKFQDTLRKRYRDFLDKRSEFDTGEVPAFEAWAKENYPELYSRAFASKKGSLPGFDFKGIASRVKRGANAGTKMPSASASQGMMSSSH